jgi:polyisoprenoid-binding protein YceI
MLLWAAAPAFGDSERTEVALASGSRLWIEGDSNWCTFSVEAKRVDLSVPAAASDLNGLRAVIPVSRLESGNGVLDDNLRRALRAEKNPLITLEIASVHTDGGARAVASGELTLAGVRRPFSFDVTVVHESAGVRLTGRVPLKMSDFGVQPPVVMGGLIRAADQVLVRLDLRMARYRLRGS